MKIQIRKYYYGDIPEDNAGGTELKDSKVLRQLAEAEGVGRSGKFLSAANRALIINM